MGVIVTFNYATWIARYPEFAHIDIDVAQMYFNEATLYFRNDGGGPVTNAGQASALLNMLTAHIAKLNSPTATGGQPSELVGRLNSASEGSVSIGAEYQAPANSAWFSQTKYGAAFWDATRAFRTMRYLPGPQRRFDSFRIRF